MPATDSSAFDRKRRQQLQASHVVRVEPGFCYPEIGGVRLEDVARVTRTRPRNQTRFAKVLEVGGAWLGASVRRSET